YVSGSVPVVIQVSGKCGDEWTPIACVRRDKDRRQRRHTHTHAVFSFTLPCLIHSSGISNFRYVISRSLQMFICRCFFVDLSMFLPASMPRCKQTEISRFLSPSTSTFGDI